MVDKRDCSFCGRPIEPGSGKLFVRKDGSKLWFCSHKCQANMLDLKRINRNVKWTRHYVKGGGKVAEAKVTRAKQLRAAKAAGGTSARPAGAKPVAAKKG